MAANCDSAWISRPSRTRPPAEPMHRSAAGQGLVEYGLILVLTTVLSVIWLVVFGGTVSDVLSAIARAIDQATGG